MAEGVFRFLIRNPAYSSKFDTIDSCGTGAYHTGDEPDSRTLSTLENNGIVEYDHSARKVRSSSIKLSWTFFLYSIHIFTLIPENRYNRKISLHLTTYLQWTEQILKI